MQPGSNVREEFDFVMYESWGLIGNGREEITNNLTTRRVAMRRTGYILVCALVIVLVFTGTVMGAEKKPTTVAELALYQGADRQQILEEGAKKEGKLVFYTSGILKQAVRPVVDAFERKYPFIKVEIWRATGKQLVARVSEEYKGRKYLFDVLESTQVVVLPLREMGVFQPFYSPNLTDIEEEAAIKAPAGGVIHAAFRASGIGLGYNTKLVNKEELPKTYKDLLDPKWKGKMAIPGSDTGVNWMGAMHHAHGEEFVKQVAKQNCDVHMVSGRALLDMVINGEYALSPSLFDSHVFKSKKQGAPCDWIPLEPVHVNVGQISLSKNAAHPHAALLFIDFELTKEGAEIHKAAGYSPFHKEVPPLAKAYKKYYGAESLEDVKRMHELFDKLFLKK